MDFKKNWFKNIRFPNKSGIPKKVIGSKKNRTETKIVKIKNLF